MYHEMLDVWEEEGPPVHISVAGYLGLAKPSSGGTKGTSSGKFNDLDELLEAFPGGMIQ